MREEPKMALLPTEMTAMRMTAFMMPGRMAMPALSMAMTKGEAAVSAADLAPRSLGWLYGTRRLTRVRETV